MGADGTLEDPGEGSAVARARTNGKNTNETTNTSKHDTKHATIYPASGLT